MISVANADLVGSQASNDRACPFCFDQLTGGAERRFPKLGRCGFRIMDVDSGAQDMDIKSSEEGTSMPMDSLDSSSTEVGDSSPSLCCLVVVSTIVRPKERSKH